MDNPNITMEEYIRLQEEKALSRGEMFNWQTATYVNMPTFPSPEPEVSYFNDLDFFKDFENVPAIVYNDDLTSKLDLLTEPTISPRHIDEFDLKDKTSLSEYTNNDNDEIDVEQPSGDMSVIPLPNVIKVDTQVFMEYLVKISKKARILELKRRHLKIIDSNILYAVSIKEDAAYLCLHFTRNHKEIKSNTPYPRDFYTPYSI
ncbi:hypothetical protein Tco_1284543 [Tanacetum coccineum]